MSVGDALAGDFFFYRKRTAKKILRIIVFSATDIPIATAVIDGGKTFKKAEEGMICNRNEICFRWIVSEKRICKPKKFRIYPNWNSEIDDNYYWEGSFNNQDYLTLSLRAKSNFDDLRFRKAALIVELSS